MSSEDHGDETGRPRSYRQPPAFNVPGVVLAAIVVFAAVHAMRVYLLDDVSGSQFVLDFSFIPGCYAADCVATYGRDPGAGIWSPLTYAFLHGDITHLGLNTVWLLAFGTPVARRLGALGFLCFGALGAVAGAAVFYALHADLIEPVIGASGIVSALMGGACRFAFTALHRAGHQSARAPLLSIGEALSDRTILFFIIIFFATNILTGFGAGAFLDGGAEVAWEAHLGGFVFGFLGIAMFDRLEARRAPS